MRRKWRGMGLIQHKAKQVRVLGEHSVSIGLLYTEATQSIMGVQAPTA